MNAPRGESRFERVRQLATPRVVRALSTLFGVAALGALAWGAWSWYDSRLPGTYSVMEVGELDFGGGPAGHHHSRHSLSVASLTGPSGEPDFRRTLTARKATVRLPSGREVDALTYDGRIPGPELRVRRGDLVEVTLLNKDVEGGVSIHWHGVDVPNAEDGVSGVTQDAVRPGGRHTYRVRAEQAGTFWYHTHQSSAKEVRRGLYGALVVLPERRQAGLDLAVAAHTLSGSRLLGASDLDQKRSVAPGTPVRLRLLNTDSTPQRFVLAGTRFRVVSIDGFDVHGPRMLAKGPNPPARIPRRRDVRRA